MSNAWQLAIGTNTPTNVSAALGVIAVADPKYLAFAGGILGDVLTTDGAGGITWQPPPGKGGGVADAPLDGATYGRKSAAWIGVLPIAGGTLTGLLTLSGPPTAALHAATKQYVDAHTAPIAVDNASIVGNGVAIPLSVGTIDGGTY